VNLIPLLTVEFWRDVRGPGPRTADATATFTTQRVHPGELEPRPTGLLIFLDRAASCVYLVRKDEKNTPVTVHSSTEIRRAIPTEIEWLMKEAKQDAGR
jgi:hypothetical protein